MCTLACRNATYLKGVLKTAIRRPRTISGVCHCTPFIGPGGREGPSLKLKVATAASMVPSSRLHLKMSHQTQPSSTQTTDRNQLVEKWLLTRWTESRYSYCRNAGQYDPPNTGSASGSILDEQVRSHDDYKYAVRLALSAGTLMCLPFFSIFVYMFLCFGVAQHVRPGRGAAERSDHSHLHLGCSSIGEDHTKVAKINSLTYPGCCGLCRP